MTDRSSRHAGLGTYRRAVPGRPDEVELYEPRLRHPLPAVRRRTATGADRLDLLAHAELGDPHRFWCLADADPEVDLDDLVAPGRAVRIPRPPT